MGSVALWPQGENGQIVGTVMDQTGAVVSGASVTAKNLGTGATRSTTTSSNGTYTLPNLPPSSYEVTVDKIGFGTFTSRVQVSVGGSPSLDAKLGLAGSSTTVEVVGQGGVQVNTENQELSHIVNSQELVQLPTVTRNPYDLAQTSGNVTPTDVQNRSGGPAGLRGVGVNINGQREASTDILLDGGQNVDLFTASLGQQVPLDSVQEFSLINSDFTAEYGRATGGVVNVVTKSGTNNLHGSVYEFNRLSTFSSNTYNNRAFGLPKGRFTRNQFGVALGGPIKKNKIFFFANGEGTLVHGTAQQVNLVPSDAFIAASAPATQQFFNQFGHLITPSSQVFTVSDLSSTISPGFTPGPVLSALGPNFPVLAQNNYVSTTDSGGGFPQDTYNIVGRVDYNMSDKTQIFGRYSIYSENDFPGVNSQSPYQGFNTGQTIFNQNAMGSVTRVWTPAVITTFKLTFNRLNFQQPLSSLGAVPTLYPFPITGLTLTNPVAFPGYLPFNPGLGIPFGGPQNLAEVNGDTTWVRGAHSLKFGGLYIYTRDNRVFGAYETAVEALAKQGNLTGMFDNFLLGQLYQFQGASYPQGKFPCHTVSGTVQATPDCTLNLPVGPPNFSRSNRYNDIAAYAQDSWKMTPRLTLNFGLRWDYYGVQHNKNRNLDSNFYFGPGANQFEQIANGFVATTPNAPIGCKCLWNPSYRNFAPRVGFALDVFGDGKTSLRGGFGMSYERNFGNVTFNVIQNPPNYAVASIFSGQPGFPTLPVETNNFGPLSGSTGTVLLPATSLRAINANIGTAYTYLYSLALQREVVRNTVFEVAYTGTRGLHDYSIQNANQPGSAVIYLAEPNTKLPRLNNQYTNINYRSNSGFSYYNAAVVSLRTTNFMNKGLDLNVNYTWSHAIDNLSTTFSENNNNFNLGYLDPYNPVLDKGNADYDIRHRVVVSGIWSIPTPGDQKGFLGRIAGGWQIAPIFEARTGTPFSIWDSTNAAYETPRWDPGMGINNLSVSSSPIPVSPNSFNIYQLPIDPATGAAVGAGNPNDINPLLGISDFGPSCTTPGSGAVAPCQWPSTMTRRNAFRGPGWWNFTAGVYKNIKIKENVNFQLRGEFYNILNHHNFYINGLQPDVGAGVTFVQAKKGGLGNPYDERRNVQLGAKITF